MIRQLGVLATTVVLSLCVTSCAPNRVETVRLTGSPQISLDEGVGEVLLRQPGSFRGAPLDSLSRIAIEPATRIEVDNGRQVRAAVVNESDLPEYLGGFRLIDVEVRKHGAKLIATSLSPHESEAGAIDFDTWPSACGTEPGVFVGVLGASGGEVRDGRRSPSFDFTTPRSDQQGTHSWYMITAWAAPGVGVPIDGGPLDISAHDREFSETMDGKLVRLQLTRKNDRWYLQSVQTLQDAGGSWPPGP